MLGTYAEALSQRDPGIAFLKLWQMLEELTNTVGSKYDETVRLASWPFEGRTEAKELVDSLRKYRNRYVHSSQDSQSAFDIAQLLKRFVDMHLLILVTNELEIAELKDYSAVLRLPKGKELAKRIGLLRRANRLQKARLSLGG